MSRNFLILLAAGGSVALLLGALAFQYIGGLYPCVLCMYQRWPHLAAVIVGLIALRVKGPALPVLGALAALTTAGVGVFHVGVEQQWWAGLQQCAVNTLGDVSMTDLLNTDIDVGAAASCDKIAWSLFGISMAGWNVLASVVFAGLWLSAARKA
jgi:disulfide bond formation protein DsbB